MMFHIFAFLCSLRSDWQSSFSDKLQEWLRAPELFLHGCSMRPGEVAGFSVEWTPLQYVYSILESSSTRALRGVTEADSVLVV